MVETATIFLIIIAIILVGLIVPPDNPITVRIINSLTDSLSVTDIGPQLKLVRTAECEEQGGIYNSQTLECSNP